MDTASRHVHVGHIPGGSKWARLTRAGMQAQQVSVDTPFKVDSPPSGGCAIVARVGGNYPLIAGCWHIVQVVGACLIFQGLTPGKVYRAPAGRGRAEQPSFHTGAPGDRQEGEGASPLR